MLSLESVYTSKVIHHIVSTKYIRTASRRIPSLGPPIEVIFKNSDIVYLLMHWNLNNYDPQAYD